MNARSLLVALVIALAASHARADHFTVNSTADAIDASLGDGVCATSTSTCTLRAAIQESNALPDKDVIVLSAATYTLSIAGEGEDDAASGDLDILDDVAIYGAGPSETSINANDLDRVFDCGPHGFETKAEIAGLRVTGGYAFSGGGILSECDLELREVALVGNSAAAGGGLNVSDYFGTSPITSLLRVEVSGNEASSGGGIYVSDSSPLDVRFSVFEDNMADTFGGAIDAFYGTVTVEGTLFKWNGSVIHPAIDARDVFINASTFATHTGGASSGTVNANNSAEITNSTFFDNWLPLGGAIGASSDAQVIVNNSSFRSNRATDTEWSDTTGASLSGGVDSAFTVSNSLFEGESPSACNAHADYVSLGHNNVEDDSCGFGATGDTENDPNLDLAYVLGDHGGPTPTLELTDFGDVIDRASPALPGSAAGAPELRDQRYVERPVRGEPFAALRADIGAVEACFPNSVESTTDSDLDGEPDTCDGDDDNDGCWDPFDTEPLAGMKVAGKIVHFCGSDDVYYAFEGSDVDGDGLLNCEDDDDDNDGAADESDPCPVDVLPSCVKPGVYFCLPRWLECLGGSCVQNFLRFYELINPDPTRELRFEKFAIWNEQIFMAPLAGQTAAQSIGQIASNAPQMNARRAGIAAAAPSRALQGRVRIEMWSKATRSAPERRLAVVGEYDAGRVRLGTLHTGNVIALQPPADTRTPLAAHATWVQGAMPREVADLDADGFPNGFDNCAFTPNVDQRDGDQNGLGDRCEIAPRAR
jgi:CSLREA domain-containing protein